MKIEMLGTIDEMKNAEIFRGNTQSSHIKAVELYLAGDEEPDTRIMDVGQFIDELWSIIESDANKELVCWGGFYTNPSTYIDIYKVIWDLDQNSVITMFRAELENGDFAYLVALRPSVLEGLLY
jgi:hypothetical protein